MNKDFKFKLRELINKYSKENDSNTPDFIITNYIEHCLNAFNDTILQRDKWYNTCKKEKF